VERFYQGLLGNRLRSIETQAGEARRFGLNALESRGMGQSSEVGRTLQRVNTQAGVLGQQAQTQVQALRFAQFQGALDFERQKALIKLGHDLSATPWWQTALGDIGDAVGMYVGYGGGFGGTQSGVPGPPRQGFDYG
jgi:hypothetical protein